MSAIARLERAVDINESVHFDRFEASELLFEFMRLERELKEEKAKYVELLGESLSSAKYIVGGLLTATLNGNIKGK